jgi:hypothetical protein
MLWALNDRRAFVNRDGFFVHAGKEQAQTAGPVQPAQAAKVPKPTEMWEIE